MRASDQTYAELVRAYDAGLLTPFTGAGLSVPACPLWPEFVRNLEHTALIPPGKGDDAPALVRRAFTAVRVLRNRSDDALADAVRASMNNNLGPARQHPPPQLEALADIWWPLIITTNYESLFVDVWNRKHADSAPLPEFNRMEVVGRGRADCQRVLNSTRAPENPLLWAIQGYIGPTANQALVEQLTIGHEEYRRHVHESVHFRRAFAEVYRSRVLFFVGSGLSESYFLDLFGEALELMGAIDHFHFAVVETGSVDTEFLLRRFQILAIEYEIGSSTGHGEQVATLIRELKRSIDAPRVRKAAWSLKFDAERRLGPADRDFDLKVVRASVLKRKVTEPRTAIAISAGVNRKSATPRPLLGPTSIQWLKERKLSRDDAVPAGEYIWRIPESDVYFVVARDLQNSGSKARDARHLVPATRELLKTSTADGYSQLWCTLLAGGAKRTFPPHIALRQMIRGYREWYEVSNKNEAISLTIHLADQVVVSYLESGRVDLASIAAVRTIYFWVRINRGTKTDAPILDFAASDCLVEDIAARHAITDQRWCVSVRPAPAAGFTALSMHQIAVNAYSIGDLGVTDGAMLLFSKEVK